MCSPNRYLRGLALLVLLGTGGPALGQQPLAVSSLWANLLAGPSPLDLLDPGRIPAEEWAAGLPEDVVAVIGSHRGRHGGWPVRCVVSCVAYSPDGKWVASTGNDRVIRLWDANTLEPVAVLGGWDWAWADGLAFSPDGKRLAAGTGEGLLLWDLGPTTISPAGGLNWEKASVEALAFSPDGKTLAVAMRRHGLMVAPMLNEDPGGWVQLLDVSGEIPREKETLAAGATVWSVAFSPDGRTLAVAGSGIDLWDVDAERGGWLLSKVLRVGLMVAAALAGALAVLGARALLPRLVIDARALLARLVAWRRREKICYDEPLTIDWFIRQSLGGEGRREEYPRLPAPLRRGAAWLAGLLAICLLVVGVPWLIRSDWARRHGLPAPSGDWRHVTFSPDGRRLAAGGVDGKVWLCDLSGRGPREEARLEGHTKTVLALAFSPDGRTLASGGVDGTLRLWDLRGGPPCCRATSPGNGNQVWTLAFSPDGRSLITGGQERILRCWDVGDTLREKDGSRGRLSAQSMALAGGGRTLFLGCDDRTVRQWDLGGPEPRERAVVKGLSDIPWWLAVSPDGRTLAFSHRDNTIRLWDLGGGVPRERASLPGPDDPEGSKDDWLSMSLREAPQVRFSPDGKFLLGVHRGLRLWDVRGPTPREVSLPPLTSSRRRRTAVFSPDGRLLAVEGANQDRILLWDLREGRPRERGVLEKGGEVAGFRPGGRTLLAVHFYYGKFTMREWDLESRRLIRETPLEGKVQLPWRGLWAEARILADFTDDESRHLVVWSPATGKRLGEYHFPGSLVFPGSEPLALAPDGRHLAVNKDGMVYILRIAGHGKGGPEDHYRRGLLHAGHQDYERAITAFSEAIRLDPKHASAYYQRGLAHAARGEYAEAKKDLDRAIDLDPKLGPPPRRGK